MPDSLSRLQKLISPVRVVWDTGSVLSVCHYGLSVWCFRSCSGSFLYSSREKQPDPKSGCQVDTESLDVLRAVGR